MERNGCWYMKIGKRGKSSESVNIFIIIAIIVVVGISIALLLRSIPGRSYPAPVLEEGKDYDINHSRHNIYTIVDETGNTIELERVSTEVFQDRNGRRYKFVSGSPFKYIGEA